MLIFLIVLSIGLSIAPSAASTTTSCIILYGQCGGQTYTGSTQCCSPAICQYSNPWYSQCLTGTTVSTTPSKSTSTIKPTSSTTQSTSTTKSTSTAKPTSSTTQSTSTTKSASTTKPTSSTTQSASTTKSTTKTTQTCSVVYGQCGGIGWSGSTTCCTGSICTIGNAYYSQCLPIPGATSSSSSSSSTIKSITVTFGNDGRAAGVTTRYWDCCKASCSWPGKALVTNPVETCAQDGNTTIDANTNSICNGGSAYMCINQQPWAINDSLSYGYAAANIAGQSEATWCCACYSLVFTSGPVVGKELIVQVTNTGGDLGNNHFDLQIPGGGVGIFNGCKSQFPGSYTWGQQYGGVSQRSDCAGLPPAIQAGCYWRFDWFMGADNPTISFNEVACPAALIMNTQCSRL